MSNLDLIDAYLAGKLNPQERADFELRLRQDNTLQEEFNFQKDIVEGLKVIRKAQLKARLDNIPVSGGPGSSTFAKAALAIAVAGLVGFGIYALWPEKIETSTIAPVKESVTRVPEEEQMTEIIEEEQESSPIEEKREQIIKEEPVTAERQPEISEEATKVEKQTTPAEPVIPKPGLAPTFEMAEEGSDSLKAPANQITPKTFSDEATFEVLIDNSHKNLTFHYRFKDKKLFLYGDFNEALFEILEVKDQNQVLFLYFKDQFYALKIDQTKESPLVPVKDQSLIDKLKMAREE